LRAEISRYVFAALRVDDGKQLALRHADGQPTCFAVVFTAVQEIQSPAIGKDRRRGSAASDDLTSVPFFGTCEMIRTFRDKLTEALGAGKSPKRVPRDVAERAVRRLFLLDTVTRLEDLRVPPGNRLEALGGDRLGQHSIRINDQWRICFVWRDGDAYDVEFVDYH
jgi:toxin HigB-1